MADRYWVGGAGTWDATTTTNWSATSGGTGGASAPTSADNVFFDTLSNATAYAVTVGTNANALDVTIAGPLVGNVTITSGATSVINCFGSWTNAATGVVFTTTSGAALNFLSTTTGRTITTNNVTLGLMQIVFNGAGGGWALGSAFTSTTTFTTTNGSFSTSASNYALTTGAITASGTLTRSISLNASAVTVTAATPINIANVTNLTFNAGTSTITCTAASPLINGGAQTFYNVTFSSTATGTTTIQGANTFNVLTQAAIAAAGLRFVAISANQTIATLTLSAGATAVTRTFVRSDVIGTQRTLTVATLSAISDVDFRDIVAAGASAASPWTGTRLGDCKNNSNITFTAAATKYWSTVNGASANWSVTAWATSSGGVPAVANFPLAQDTCIIDDSGATTGNGLRTGNTVAIDASWNMGTLNFSGRTVAFNWTQGNADPVIYGDVTLTSSMTMTTVTGTPTWTFANQGTVQALNSAGIILRLSGLTVNSPGGGVSLTTNTAVDLSPIVAPNVTGNVNLTAGTLNLNSNTLTAVTFDSSNTNTRTLAFGSTGKMDLTGTGVTVFSTSTATNLTVTGTNPLIRLTTNATTGTRGITMGAAGEANAISVDVTAGSDTIGFGTTSGSYKNVNFTGFTGTYNASNSILVFGDWNFGGVTLLAGTGTVTFSATSGTKTITSNGDSFPGAVTFNGVGGAWTLQDPMSLAGIVTLTNGTLGLVSHTLTASSFSSINSNTRALNFGTGKMVLTATNTSVYSSTTATGLTLTGSRTVEITGVGVAGETRTIQPGSIAAGGSAANAANFYIKAGSDTFSLSNVSRAYGTVDFTGFSGSTAADIRPNFYGDLVLSPTMTVAGGASAWVFVATTPQTITTSGVTINNPIDLNGIGGSWSLQDALTLGPTRTLDLITGTFTTNGYAVSCGKFQSLGAGLGSRTLNLGASSFTCFGTTTTVSSWQVADDAFVLTINAGTSTIFMAEPFTGASQQLFLGGGKTYNNVVFTTTQPGGFYDSNTFNSISNTAQPLTLSFEAGTTQTVNSFAVSGTAGNLVTLNSVTPGTQWNLVKATGSKVTVSFCAITDSNVTPTPGYWFAPTSQGNVDGGNNTGWNFGSATDNSSFMLLM